MSSPSVDAPGRVAPVLRLEDAGRVGTARIAHPDPQQAVPRFGRVRAHEGAPCGGRSLPGAFTSAGAVEDQPVVAALDVVALDSTHRQWHFAVRAGVGQRAVCTAGSAVDGDVLAQDGGRVRRVADFAFPRCDIPGVAEKHQRNRSPPPLDAGWVGLGRQVVPTWCWRSAHRTGPGGRRRWRPHRAAGLLLARRLPTTIMLASSRSASSQSAVARSCKLTARDRRRRELADQCIEELLGAGQPVEVPAIGGTDGELDRLTAIDRHHDMERAATSCRDLRCCERRPASGVALIHPDNDGLHDAIIRRGGHVGVTKGLD